MTGTEDDRSTATDINNNLVAASLLSLSKDNRYIKQCQTLLLDALEPILGGFFNNTTTTSEAFLKTGTWYTSYILYLYLVVSKSGGRSLGMEATGLSFSTDTKKKSKKTALISLLVMGLSSFFLDHYLPNASSTSNNNNSESLVSSRVEALRGTDRRAMHERMRQQMLRTRTTTQQHQTSPTTVNSLQQQQRQTFARSLLSSMTEIFEVTSFPFWTIVV